MENKLYYYLEILLKILLQFFTIVLIILLVMTSLKPFGISLNNLSVRHIQVWSLVLQIVSIVFSICYDFIVKYNIFHGLFIYNMIGYIREKTIIQRSRSELRSSLNIITAFAIGGTLYFYLMTNELLIFMTVLLVIYLAYMYADYFPYTILCGKYYDSFFIKKGTKPKMNRGLARIYLKEYELTKFDRKHSFYDTRLENIKYNKNDPYQDDCIKEILRNWADNLTAPDIIVNIIMFIINFIMLVAATQIEDIVKIYIPNGLSGNLKEIILIIFIIIINAIFSYISYKGVKSCRKNNLKTKAICDIIKSDDKKARFDFFISEYPNISKTVISRGTYEFNISYTTDIKSYNLAEDIPFPYRTLFIDRMYSHKERFELTSKAIFFIILFVLITFKINYLIIGIVLVLYLVLKIILKKVWLPNIGKKSIIKEALELLKK